MDISILGIIFKVVIKGIKNIKLLLKLKIVPENRKDLVVIKEKLK